MSNIDGVAPAKIWGGLAPGGHRLRFTLLALGLAGLMVLSVGCGAKVESTDMYPLSGQITYQGNPIPKGNITLSPDSSRGNKGPGATAEIKNGRYETMAGKGVVGGPYIVTVQGYDGVPIESGEGGMDEQGTALFPPKKIEVDLGESESTYDIELD